MLIGFNFHTKIGIHYFIPYCLKVKQKVKQISVEIQNMLIVADSATVAHSVMAYIHLYTFGSVFIRMQS